MHAVGVEAELEEVAAVHPAEGFGDLVAVFVGEGAAGLVGGGSEGEAGGVGQHGDGGRKTAGTGRFAGDEGLRHLVFEVAAPGVAQLVEERVAEGGGEARDEGIDLDAVEAEAGGADVGDGLGLQCRRARSSAGGYRGTRGCCGS